MADEPLSRKSDPQATGLVRAAGVVLWRHGRGGRTELALVHRPKYDDWSFPKGKLDPGEDWAEAALRETREETGFRVRLGRRLPSTHYIAAGRPKEVRYWAAVVVSGAFAPNDEVDALVWFTADEARARLDHPHDRSLLDTFLRTVPGASAPDA